MHLVKMLVSYCVMIGYGIITELIMRHTPSIVMNILVMCETMKWLDMEGI
jgi:hypothetical protein